MEGDVEGVWSVLGTPRSWFWYTFCICDSPFLVLYTFWMCVREWRVREWRVREWRVRQWRVGDGCGGCVEGDVEGWWSVLGTPRSWFWYTFCICDSPFLFWCTFWMCVREWRVREWRVRE